jgi:hypothetical protein
MERRARVITSVKAWSFALVAMPFTIGVIGGLACSTMMMRGYAEISWNILVLSFPAGATVGVFSGLLLSPLVYFIAREVPIATCWVWITGASLSASMLAAALLPSTPLMVWLSGGIGFSMGYVVLLSGYYSEELADDGP